MQRSISLPVKALEEYQPCLERSKEIEELREELFEENNDDDDLSQCSSEHIYICNKYTHSLDFQEPLEKSDDKDINLLDEPIKTEVENYDECLHDTNEGDIATEEHSLTENSEKSTRVIYKSGRRNISLLKIPKKSLRYCKDFVTTLIEQKWRYTLTVFVGSFLLSWIIFTMLWYLIAYAHGDLTFDENGSRLGEDRHPCIVGAKSLLEIFIFTVETQITIGFGEKYPSEECPESVFLFVVHLIVSVALEGAMVGIIYSKMSRPVKYTAKYRFSKSAVICQRDGQLCLIFRVCDPEEHQSIGTRISAYILMDKQTAEGEHLIKVQKELKIFGSTSPLVVWPETICHIIDENSPLFECIEGRSFIKHFEIYVSLVGSSPSLGHITESKTSYLPCEVYWDHRFANIILYDCEKENYFIDYDHFNSIIPTINNK